MPEDKPKKRGPRLGKMGVFERLHAMSLLALRTLVEYRRRQPLLLSSSTAFFTLFALPPILIVLITVLGLVIKPYMLRAGFFNELAALFGEPSANQLHLIFDNFQSLASNPVSASAGFVFLIFVSTTLLNQVKQVINSLWDLKRARLRWTDYLLDRAMSLLVIFAGGLLFLVTLLSDTFLTFIGTRLEDLLPGVDTLLIRFIHAVFSLVIVSLWFTLLFKILPNAKIQWRPAIVGGLFTALLFTAGKFVLGRILVGGNLDTIFGAAGGIVLVLLFIFYSAMIFYYGSLFTKNYAEAIERPIQQGIYSMRVKLMELDGD
jgi:membrane protein